METIAGLGLRRVLELLETSGVAFNSGPFNISVQSDIPSIADHLFTLYSGYPLVDDSGFIDFYISLDASTGLRRYIRPQVIFSHDGFTPFTPLPLNQAPAQFEWGLNWCVASHAHQFMIIHSAVLEKDGFSIIMPGAPGSGKSTLCAALVVNGWRLLSDEMALLSLDDMLLQPVPRPVSLKNRSIDIIRSYAPDFYFGKTIHGTTKGDIRHMKVPQSSIQQQDKKPPVSICIFPRYQIEVRPGWELKDKASSCMLLIQNIFNFNILGKQGFQAVTDLIEQINSYAIFYPGLDQAVKLIDRIVAEETSNGSS